MDYANDFVAALDRHDMPQLRAAFEAAKKVTGERYDRTTLNRWIDGSIPTKETFIRQLATELDDETVFTAWSELRQSQSPSQGRSVVSRYQGLSKDEKDWVFHEIRAEYLSTFPSVRSRSTWRVEVNDPAESDDDHLVMRLENTFTGAIPAAAEAHVVTGHEDLGDAYENPDCIFRDIVAIEPARLSELLDTQPAPVLAINPRDSSAPRGSQHLGTQIKPGRFRFDNAAATDAQVRLTITYPYPRGHGIFPIRLGRYQVPDTFEVTLRLNSRSASSPRAFPFLPPGRQREFAESYPAPDELFFTFGTGNTVYGEGDGLVLSWTES